MKKDLLFYDEYEQFYSMTNKSNAFKAFCKNAFGEDFSQDGFSDIRQIDMILTYIPSGDDVHILDIGCGNGKMLGYLQKKTGAYIHGFDYSEHAINTAKELFQTNAEFKDGIIGEIDYPSGQFDVITSMDSMYFAKDMVLFVSQIKRWLKQDGAFFVGYQEGEVMQKTEDMHSTALAKALEENHMSYDVIDITKQTYDMLKNKRNAAIKCKEIFEAEGNMNWYDMLIAQTECAMVSYEEFAVKMVRYIYVARK